MVNLKVEGRFPCSSRSAMVRHYLLVGCFLLTTCAVSGQRVTYGLQGQVVSLKPGVGGLPDDILWTHDGNKVVEFNGQEQHAYSRYKNRVILDWLTAELNITNLAFEDSGDYELEAYINKNLNKFNYKLEVIGKVAKPTISCDMDHGSSNVNGPQATLMCSSDSTRPQSLLEFEWDSRGSVQPGPKLTISLRDEHDDKTYTCTARNPLSTEAATFTAKDCYAGTSSSTTLGASIAVPIILILVAVAVVVVIVYFKLKRKVCFASRQKNDEEKWMQHGETHESHEEGYNLLGQTSPSSPSDGMPPKGHVRAKKEKLEQLQRDAQKSKKPGPPTPPKRPFLPQKEPPIDDKEDADAQQFSGAPETMDPDVDSSVDEPEPELVASEDTQSNVKPASAPEQPDAQKSKKPGPPPPPPKRPFLPQKEPPIDDKEDADAQQFSGAPETMDPDVDSSVDEPEPELVASEDTQSNVKPASAPEQPEIQKRPPPPPKKKPSLYQKNPPCSGSPEKKDPDADSSVDKPEPELVASEDTQSNVKPASAPEQPDAQKIKKPGPPPPPPKKKPSLYQKKPPCSGSPEKKDPDVDSSVDKPEPELVASEDTQSNVEPASAPEQPESEKEKDEKEKGKSPSTAQPQSPLTQNAPDMRPEDAASEHKEEANSDQVSGETSEGESDSARSKKKDDDSIEEEKEKASLEQNSSEAASQ